MTDRSLSRQKLIDVLSLGLLLPRVPPTSSLQTALEVGIEAAADVLFRHKVANIALARLNALPTETDSAAGHEVSDALGSALRARRDSFNDRYATAPEIVGLLRKAAAEHGIRVLTMKGMAVESWYPRHRPRDVGDLDIWVPDAASAWTIARGLREHGYLYAPEELPWLKRDVDGVLYGQVRLVEPKRRSVSVDIHVGPYSVRHCGLLALPSAVSREAWQPLSDEDLLCAAVANAAGDCFLDGKTINDLVLGLLRPVDLTQMLETMRDAGMLGFLAAALDVVTDVCALPAPVRDAVARLRPDEPAEPISLTARVDTSLRVRLVSQHARWVAAVRLGYDAPGAARVADGARQAYERPATLHVEPQADARRIAMPLMSQWSCVRLAPVAAIAELAGWGSRACRGFPIRTDAATSPSVVSLPAGDLVEAGGDLFVPTVDYAISERLVTAALAALETGYAIDGPL